MKQVADSQFALKSWDEQPYSEGPDLPKMTRAAVTRTFSGDLAGEGQVEYLMVYRSDGAASFVGLERIVGQLAGKRGSFVLQRSGVFENGTAKESYAASLAQGRESSAACAGRVPRRSGMEWSIRLP